jgi:hypothetical protein
MGEWSVFSVTLIIVVVLLLQLFMKMIHNVPEK